MMSNMKKKHFSKQCTCISATWLILYSFRAIETYVKQKLYTDQRYLLFLQKRLKIIKMLTCVNFRDMKAIFFINHTKAYQ